MQYTHTKIKLMACLGVITLLCIGPSVVADTIEFKPPVQTGQLTLASMDEVSGISASRNNSGILWMHNDHGDSPRIYAVDMTGQFRGIYNLFGAENVDWEDMAIGPGPASDTNYIYIGDVGNNDLVRGDADNPLTIYRTPEPTLPAGSALFQKNIYDFETINLTYPAGQSYNSEAIFVDPISADLFLITRQSNTSRLFRATASDMLDGNASLTFVSYVNMHKPTAADISPDGDEIILRSENAAYLWQRNLTTEVPSAFSQTPTSIALANEFNGEALGFDRTGDHYYTTSEGIYAPVYFYERIIEEIELPGDINGDGSVGLLDLDILGQHYGNTNALPEHGDINGDREVGLLDLDILGQNFGRTINVPEPTGLTLILLAGMIVRRNRH